MNRSTCLVFAHGRKAGQLLYDKAIAIAKGLMLEYLWLGVWEKNEREISFYQKKGFVALDKHIFRLGEEERTDTLMKKILKR